MAKISEAVWSKALVVELNYETSPAENTTPPVKTTVYLYEDGETLYVAFDARDDNPEQIRDFLLDRDNIWRMEILRFYPRNEVQRFANSPLDRNISCQICQYDQLLGFAQINQSNNLRLVPTLVVDQSESRDSNADSRWQSNDISAAITNFRLSYLFNERSSIRFTLQQVDIERDPSLYNSFLNQDVSDDEEAISKTLATQLLYTYRVNPQTLFFAGYSHEGYQDDSLNHLRKTFKTLFMKFSYAWQI